MVRLGTLIVFVASLAPWLAADAQAAGEHPDSRYVTRTSRALEVRFDGSAANAPSLVSPTVLARIGAEDGADHEVFGDMVSAIVVDDSTIAVIDGSASEVRLFSRGGRHLQTFGRSGSGPGEFRGAVAIVRAPDGALIVADTRRTLQYFYRERGSYTYRRTASTTVGVRSMCFLGGTLYVNGASLDDGKVIRALDETGAATRAFGEVYRSPNPLLNYQVAQGRLACDESRQLIYYMAGSLLGEVRAFRPTGEEVWSVRVGDFRTNRIVDTGGGSLSVVRSASGAHAAGNVLSLGASGVLAQWTFITRAQMEAKELPTEVLSVLIDPASGSARFVGSALPLLKDAKLGLVLGFGADPVPQLEVRRVPTGAP